MKLYLSLITAIALCGRLNAQGIEFFHGSWDEALELSKKEGRPLFVDAYAKWCGPCKRMAATTFKSREAGEFFNKNFINVKIDAEEKEGVVFRRKYPVSAFPTLYFIDENGEVIHSAVGAKDEQGLIKLGEFALGKVDYSREYAAEYEKGKRDSAFLYDYVKALNRSNKSSLRISNEYLRSQEDLGTPFNLRFILEACTEADSRIFSLLIQYQEEIAKLEGRQAVYDRIKLACENTLLKAIEFNSPELLEETKLKMKTHHPRHALYFAADADRQYYLATKDSKRYCDACSELAKVKGQDNADLLAKLADEMMSHFSQDTRCAKLAEKLAKNAVEASNDYDHWLLYSRILMTNGKKKNAIEAAEKALDLAKAQEDKDGIRSLENYLKSING